MVSVNQRAGRCAVAALVLALASCTAKPAPSPSAATPPVSLHSPSPSPSPTDPRVGAVQTAVAAYRAMWQAYTVAIEVPDPNSPDLARYATGSALSTLVSGIKSVKDQGMKGTGQLVLSPQVVKITPTDSPTSVDVQDCFDDAATHLVSASPGSTGHDTPGGRRLCLATVERQADGSWKVTHFGLRGVGTC